MTQIRPEEAAGGGPESAIPVLYIVGAGRSGSTILAHLLGEIEGYVSVGELRNLWVSAILQGSLCSCGAALPECSFWGPIVNELDLADRGRAKAIWEWQRRHLSATRPLNLTVARPGSRKRNDPGFRSYSASLVSLYRSIAKHSGARVIVDSSKAPVDAAALAAVDGIVPSFVHLVRDPRAVVYSWARKKAADPSGTRLFSRRGMGNAVATWIVHNLESHAAGRLSGSPPPLFLRYEDFVDDPSGAVARIRKLVEGDPPAGHPAAREVELHVQHSIGGNPVRFKRGRVEITPDEEWKKGLPRGRRWFVTAATLPLLLRYGYRPNIFTPRRPEQAPSS